MKKLFNIKKLALYLMSSLSLITFADCSKGDAISDKNILVLDDFRKKTIEINDDDTLDISHGELVSKIIEEGLPDYNIDKRNTYIRGKSASWYKKELFDDIVNNGKKYEAANVSIGVHIEYEKLSALTGIDVNQENIASKAKEVKAYLKEHPQEYLKEGNLFFDAEMGGVADFIDVLDSLSAKGTKVYVSTSNSGPNYLNLVSLVDGAIVVGSADSTGVKYYCSDNSLVKRYYNDEVKITKTKDGYSINGGKTTTFNTTQVSKGSGRPYHGIHEGASMASPRVLVNDILIKKPL